MIPSSIAFPLALHALTYLVPSTHAAYTIQDDYEPSNFFNMFDFFTGPDPTSGYVNYLDQTDSQVLGLTNTNNGQIYMGVDHSTIAPAPGRSSVRISSKNSYNHGLIILDLEHMPGGICGTWPAFWLLGPNWPNSGEVDIIEGVNSQNTNQMTLHTNSGCSITNNGLSSGNILGTNCDVAATGNAGCSIATTNTQTYGNGFNAANGGVYATEWTSQAISIWFFPRGSVPADISSGSPNPFNWGLPIAEFSGACDLDEHVVNQQIVFDTTFCGQWAGEVWSEDPVCSKKADTCVDYVMNNPTDFTNAYWSINSLKVYQQNGAASPSSPTSSGPVVLTSTSFIATATVTASTPTVPTTFATSTFSPPFFSPTSTFTLTSTFITPTAVPTSFTNTFFTPTAFPTTSFSYSYTPPSTWSTSWTQPTGTNTWGSWGGGNGGGGGGGFGGFGGGFGGGNGGGGRGGGFRQ